MSEPIDSHLDEFSALGKLMRDADQKAKNSRWVRLSQRLRKIVMNLKRKVKDHNKYARKVIPREYCDKPELIRDFLFAVLIDFVENEKPFDNTDYYDTEYVNIAPDEASALFADDLFKHYTYVKYTRDMLIKEHEGEIGLWIENHWYVMSDKAGAEIRQKDDEVVQWIAINYMHLWT